MNITLWILSDLLALAMAMAGGMKLLTPKAKLEARMAWTRDFSPASLKLIGGAELLGAIGLVVPALTGIAPILSPLAATGLLLLMAGAAWTHLRLGEPKELVPSVALALLALVVAIGRFHQLGIL